MKEYYKKDYQRNKERILKRNKEWRQNNKERKKLIDKEWYEKNKDTENYKKNKRETSRQLRKKYPKKMIARNKARYLKGIPNVCEECGSNENLEKHHPDYSQPSNVVVLCRDCHNIETELSRRKNEN